MIKTALLSGFSSYGLHVKKDHFFTVETLKPRIFLHTISKL